MDLTVKKYLNNTEYFYFYINADREIIDSLALGFIPATPRLYLLYQSSRKDS